MIDPHSPKMRPPSLQRLQLLATTIRQICDISDIPAASVGVVDHGQVLHTADFGYCDVGS
jgi:hypothetical protein